MLEVISAYLQAKGAGTINSDIFLGELPDTKKASGSEVNVDNCIALFSTGGYEPGLDFAGENVEYPTFQVLGRDRSYQAGFTKINSIYKLLHGNTDMFPLIIAQQPPAPLGRDEKKRWEFSVNFKITKEM
jgi:hypothetical protein